MIVLLTGDNEYQAKLEIEKLAHEIECRPEFVDSDSLDAGALADIFKGASLFSEQRLIIVTKLSDNSQLWELAAEWAGELPDGTTIVLREPKPDKRTKVYKALILVSKLIVTESLTEKQQGLAVRWVENEAKHRQLALNGSQVRDIVSRALIAGADQRSGRIVDQLLIAQALDALRSLDNVSDADIATVLPPSIDDEIFGLLELAVGRNAQRLREQLDDLMVNHEGFQILAIVITQWSQLVMVAIGDGEANLGIHPFVRQKLGAIAKQFSRAELAKLTKRLTDLDAGTKSTGLSPWDALSVFLFEIAAR